MAKDNFWNDGTTSERRHENVRVAMNAAAARENAQREIAEAQKRQLEEEAQRPPMALCKKCGKMSTDPCRP